MRKLIYLLIINLIVISACSNDDQPVKENDCPDNMVCTEILISLTFIPRDSNDNPIFLDSYYSQNLDNGKTYSITNGSLLSTASYVVVSDEQLDEINQNGTNIRFIGLQGNQIVVQQDFVVGHDCCHVVPLAGPFEGQ